MSYSVQNANYQRVMAIMEKFLKERYPSTCNCPRCISDITAIALNLLPPHYYVDSTVEGEPGSPWVMIETAVVEAIDRVSEHPNHPRQQVNRVESTDSTCSNKRS